MIFLFTIVFGKRIVLQQDSFERLIFHFVVIATILMLMQLYINSKRAMRFVPHIIAIVSYYSHNRSLAFYHSDKQLQAICGMDSGGVVHNPHF